MTTTIDLTTISIDQLDQITDMATLSEWTKGCAACSLRQHATQVVHHDGDPESPVMVVGIGPAFADDAIGIPFVGRQELQDSHCVTCTNYSKCYEWQTGTGPAARPRVDRCTGHIPDPSLTVHTVPSQVNAGYFKTGGIRSAAQIFDDLLDTLGILRSKLFLTNGTLCKSQSGSTPRPAEFNRCSSIRLQTQRILKPKVIITLGNDATQLYTSKKVTMSRVHGIPINYQDGEFITAVVVPTYHPASILRKMLESSRYNLNELTALKTAIRDEKWALFEDLTTAFNLLDPAQIAGLVKDPSVLVNGKLPVKVR